MGVEHFVGDDCRVYDPEAELKVIGDREPVMAEDVEVGYFVNDPARDARNAWFEVDSVETLDDGVHIFVVEASKAEIAQARRDACEGHETTQSAIGDTYYCDGSYA